MMTALGDLLPFFEGAEDAKSDQQVAAWLGGPTFQGANAGKLKDAIAIAVEGYEKSLRAERRAERAEIGIIWFCGWHRPAYVKVPIFPVVAAPIVVVLPDHLGRCRT